MTDEFRRWTLTTALALPPSHLLHTRKAPPVPTPPTVGPGGLRDHRHHTIAVRGLPRDTARESVARHFSRFGVVRKVTLRHTGTSRSTRALVALITFSDPTSAERVLNLHNQDSWLTYNNQRLRVELAHKDPATPDKTEDHSGHVARGRRGDSMSPSSSNSDSPTGLRTLERRFRRARQPEQLRDGTRLPPIGNYHCGPAGFAGSDLSFAPSAVCRTACLNIEGASPTKDYSSAGGIIGLYCLRWRIPYAFLTEVPLRKGTESAINTGLAPYGYACRCPPLLGAA